ncbi:MAG TPA: hypothetical protein VL334_03365 [Anaerolineae bacterium]|nr:hypothetical protein [Anaerolineae bacterium]
MTTIASEHFKQALLIVLDETFDNVRGVYLDKGTSLFETLAGITAEEASIPVGGKCATLAAQVKHVAFYLEVVERAVRSGDYQQVDWGQIWHTVGAVSPGEWAAIQAELRVRYQRIVELIDWYPEWPGPDEIAGAIGLIAHTAYHLGEIRQALCAIR